MPSAPRRSSARRAAKSVRVADADLREDRRFRHAQAAAPAKRKPRKTAARKTAKARKSTRRARKAA